jgi:hypothetical protein
VQRSGSAPLSAPAAAPVTLCEISDVAELCCETEVDTAVAQLSCLRAAMLQDGETERDCHRGQNRGERLRTAGFDRCFAHPSSRRGYGITDR